MRGREEQNELDNEVIEIRRVAKVVKGGKNMSFRVIVAVGDRAGRVGLGKGNTREIPPAIQQGIRDAKGNLVRVPVLNGTIPHAVIGKFKAAKVLLRPAYPGTGIIAGKTVGMICRLVGIRDILAKSLGSNNPLTVAKATIEGLSQLKTVGDIARLRDKDAKEILHVKA
ncbi:MAG: 30S ribosomal protein S5 [Candidatus Fraserbacteria bacterium RBG_16_55_9]|uniref:Small ribosomal subunit protein uS5 n=1 Tax=Fraserbacteria sp. (strain RBG_16_55_9) TaxID=1817864 RepID=A0A1F5UPA5_FRAXR|nr:MAG: 30S ribosomal protein S5 [Candidatus Fraserbacteria bacterium RBG_16_55_9]